MIDLGAIRKRNERLKRRDCYSIEDVTATIDTLIAEVEFRMRDADLLRDRIQELCKREELLERQRDALIPKRTPTAAVEEIIARHKAGSPAEDAQRTEGA